MIFLDTDPPAPQVSCFRPCAPASRALGFGGGDTVGVAVVTVEEQMRGWLALIAIERHVARQTGPYRELADLFRFFAGFEIALFDARAADTVTRLLGTGVRIASMDLKIASVAVSRGDLLSVANRRHFGPIPGLRFDNWMDDAPS